MLFGSQAQATQAEDPDYDIAVFLHGMTDRWTERRRLADLRTRVLDETGVFIDIKPFPAGSYIDRTSLMREVRLDGLDPYGLSQRWRNISTRSKDCLTLKRVIIMAAGVGEDAGECVSGASKSVSTCFHETDDNECSATSASGACLCHWAARD